MHIGHNKTDNKHTVFCLYYPQVQCTECSFFSSVQNLLRLRRATCDVLHSSTTWTEPSMHVNPSSSFSFIVLHVCTVRSILYWDRSSFNKSFLYPFTPSTMYKNRKGFHVNWAYFWCGELQYCLTDDLNTRFFFIVAKRSYSTVNLEE